MSREQNTNCASPGPEAEVSMDPWYEKLVQAMYDWRRRAETGRIVIRGEEIPWYQNRQGLMRWYLHPCKKEAAIRSLLLYVQEIPPGSKSGRQRCPGGLVHFVLDGHGTVEIDGTRHQWKAGDCIALPIKSSGVECQFFNIDIERPARYLAATPNFFEILGVDLGSSFEQLEDAPF